ncbi:MAG: rRNA maturation RNase YbeY [Candidatus Dadabacteria bacterium]|nr:rRNA maturation RNase YbeY [Candidatus Dadabacteria bacterium]
MKVYIVDRVNYLNEKEKRVLQNNVKMILKFLKLSGNKDLCITFLDDNAMRKLNKTYRGIKKTTDVLSFSQDGPDTRSLGDVIISVDTAKRHALLYRKSLKREVIKLIVHGILHVLGYDHKKKNETVIMRKKEKELLSLISF